jgi:hypothetical protein
MPDTSLLHAATVAEGSEIELFVALELSRKSWVVATHIHPHYLHTVRRVAPFSGGHVVWFPSKLRSLIYNSVKKRLLTEIRKVRLALLHLNCWYELPFRNLAWVFDAIAHLWWPGSSTNARPSPNG